MHIFNTKIFNIQTVHLTNNKFDLAFSLTFSFF